MNDPHDGTPYVREQDVPISATCTCGHGVIDHNADAHSGSLLSCWVGADLDEEPDPRPMCQCQQFRPQSEAK